MIHIGPHQGPLIMQSLSCTAGILLMLQAHIPRYSHTLDAISRIYGKAHHSLSSPSWDPPCMA